MFEVVLAVAVALLLRPLWLWYWKIDETVELLRKIEAGRDRATAGEFRPPAQPSPAPPLKGRVILLAAGLMALFALLVLANSLRK